MKISKEQIVDKIKNEIITIKNNIDITSIHGNNSIIDDVGLDSLDYASLMFSCEEWLQIKIKEDGVNWAKVSTIDDLANLLFENQK